MGVAGLDSDGIFRDVERRHHLPGCQTLPAQNHWYGTRLLHLVHRAVLADVLMVAAHRCGVGGHELCHHRGDNPVDLGERGAGALPTAGQRHHSADCGYAVALTKTTPPCGSRPSPSTGPSPRWSEGRLTKAYDPHPRRNNCRNNSMKVNDIHSKLNTVDVQRVITTGSG